MEMGNEKSGRRFSVQPLELGRLPQLAGFANSLKSEVITFIGASTVTKATPPVRSIARVQNHCQLRSAHRQSLAGSDTECSNLSLRTCVRYLTEQVFVCTLILSAHFRGPTPFVRFPPSGLAI